MIVAEPRLKRDDPTSFDVAGGVLPPEGGDDDDGDGGSGCLMIIGIAILILISILVITYFQTRK